MAAQNWNLDQIELHNFAGAEEAAEFHGIALHRFPKNMRRILRADSPICGEIRFVTDAPEVHIFLGFLNSTVKQTPIRVFQGNFERELPAGFSLDNGKVTELVLSAKTMLDRMNFEEMHTQTVLASMRPDALPKGGFSPKVWRIQFDQTPRVYFCGLDTGGGIPSGNRFRRRSRNTSISISADRWGGSGWMSTTQPRRGDSDSISGTSQWPAGISGRANMPTMSLRSTASILSRSCTE